MAVGTSLHFLATYGSESKETLFLSQRNEQNGPRTVRGQDGAENGVGLFSAVVNLDQALACHEPGGRAARDWLDPLQQGDGRVRQATRRRQAEPFAVIGYQGPRRGPADVVCLSRIASNTGVRLPGEALMTCNTSAVAVCCSSASRCSVISRVFSIAITA